MRVMPGIWPGCCTWARSSRSTVPSVEQEAARDLVRAREDVRGDLMRARHRLSKLLLRHGIVYYGGRPWTGSHDLWLRAQRRSALFAAPGLGLAFDTAYDTMLATAGAAGPARRRDHRDGRGQRVHPGGDPVGVSARGGDADRVRVGRRDRRLAPVDRSLDRRLPGSGAHRVLLRGLPLAGVDHQDRQRARPPPADRGRLAPPPALPRRAGAAAPPGRGRPGRPRPRTARQPAPARPLGRASMPATSCPWSPTPRSPASWPAGAGRWPCSTD